jgi:hypothetical protein
MRRVKTGIVLDNPGCERFPAVLVQVEQLADRGVVEVWADLPARLFDGGSAHEKVDGRGYGRSVDASVAVYQSRNRSACEYTNEPFQRLRVGQAAHRPRDIVVVHAQLFADASFVAIPGLLRLRIA